MKLEENIEKLTHFYSCENNRGEGPTSGTAASSYWLGLSLYGRQKEGAGVCRWNLVHVQLHVSYAISAFIVLVCYGQEEEE